MRGSGGEAGRGGGTHLRGTTGVGGVRGAIDSSFNLVATHPSCRRRGKRAKAKEGPKGWRGRSSSVVADAGTGGGEPYLFECVVARDKNDGESLKSMWRSTATNSTSTPSSTLGGIVKTQHVRVSREETAYVNKCTREKKMETVNVSKTIFMYLLIECQALPRAISIFSESNVSRKQ